MTHVQYNLHRIVSDDVALVYVGTHLNTFLLFAILAPL